MNDRESIWSDGSLIEIAILQDNDAAIDKLYEYGVATPPSLGKNHYRPPSDIDKHFLVKWDCASKKETGTCLEKRVNPEHLSPLEFATKMEKKKAINMIKTMMVTPQKKTEREAQKKTKKRKRTNKKNSAEQNNEQMYFPERIVKDRINKGKKEYYVKWQGYDEAANTWEPQTNTSLKELIEEYENQKK